MQGKILGSRYRVIKYIAKGGFGKTYLAEDTQLPGKDRCVVKQLYPSVDDPNFVKIARRLFKTEAQTLHNLGNHDRIPQLLAYFEEDKKFYLLQQYIEGHTLSQELSDEPWSEARVIELLKDCLNILDFIHSNGVIHRDVKPDNLIRRTSDNKLVLVDFGSVKEVIIEQTQLVPVTVTVGTRGYMPTEQARGKPRTTSDIYALGVIAIQALTGIHPIELEEDENGEIVWQNQAQCGLQLGEIIFQMTRYHFKDRYQSAQEIAEALNNLENQVVAAPKTEAVQYTPTVQLSTSQLANMAGNPQSAVESESVVNDPSIVSIPDNLTNFAAKSPSTVLEADSQQQLESRDNPNFVENKSNSPSKAQKSGKIVTLGVALAISAIASGGMYLLNHQSAKTARISLDEQVKHFNQMIEQQNYKACYEEAVNLKTEAAEATANIMPKEQQEFEANCGLETAKEEANDLKYSEALAIAKTLPKNTALDADIAQQIDLWSEQLLQQATKLYEQSGNLEEAIAIVKQIPQDSAVRLQAIDAKDSWKAEHQTNEATINTAQKALSEEKWQYAKQEAAKVKDSSSIYWQEQAKAIIAQAEEGITATSPTNTKETVAPEPKDTTPAAVQPPVTKQESTNTKPTVPEPTKAIDPEPAIAPSVPPEELRDLSDDPDPSSPAPNERPLRDL